DISFYKLLEYFNLSRRGYRRVRKGVKKRISRHMMKIGCRNIDKYLEKLDRNIELKKDCELHLTVSISRFFRDRMLWECLENDIVPGLLKTGMNPIRIWSAGCASGEEVYSFKILWEELIYRIPSMPKLELMGTDITPEYLARCRAGAYPASNLKEVPDDRRDKYFIVTSRRNRKSYTIKPQLKKDITWKRLNLFDNPPDSLFHIIFLRNNILTYYNSPIKDMILNKIIVRLEPSGVLIIGSNEQLPFESDELQKYKTFSYLFTVTGKNGV
ncbi:CheR family methyltransferase, partial [Desulfobacterales bacterium HSG17]|nr:CheR family methyltransferase [Desulfobacterales bacterium HSG17]